MDLGSFPNDHTIPATIIYKLAARNLVNLIVTNFFWHDENHGDGFYSNIYIRQHDLLRELAIHENNKGAIQERKRLNLDVCKNKFPN
ncbi:hypothetical protein SAY86_017061 [Trapa natans]|uniref:Uncharacterized protein n=1 Tax=Trapa natans TaxID=22666 RepID=A0AAN7M0W0_TRANT|nr:hypothetical protein SAY86_017061 [Trapa natans]